MTAECFPAEIAAQIGGFMADSRPFLLTCRRFWAVFCEMPDVTYWISGRDLRWLLPKMVPEVWCGYVYEVIRADNVAVFCRIFDPENMERNLRLVYKFDSVEILQYLYEEYGAGNINDAAQMDAAKCVEFLIDSTTSAVTLHVIGPKVTELLYKRCGMEIIKNCKRHTYMPEDMQLLLHGIDSMAQHSPADALYFIARSDVRPRIDPAAITKGFPLEIVQEYFRIYGTKVTVKLVAQAGNWAQADVFIWLYSELVRELGHEVSFLLHAAEVLLKTRDEIEFFTSRGCSEVFAIRMVDTDYIIDELTNGNIENVKETLRDCPVGYTKELREICRANGVEFIPSEESTRFITDWEYATFLFSEAPNLLQIITPDELADRCGYRGALESLETMRRIPGAAAVVEKIEEILGKITLFTLRE